MVGLKLKFAAGGNLMAIIGVLVDGKAACDCAVEGEQADLGKVNQLAERRELLPDASAESLVAGTRAIAIAVESCNDVPELSRVATTADYLKSLLRQSSASLAQLNEAAALRLRTMRRIGTKLCELNLRGGDRRSKSHDASLNLKDLNLTKDFASRCRKIASLDNAVFEGRRKGRRAKDDGDRAL